MRALSQLSAFLFGLAFLGFAAPGLAQDPVSGSVPPAGDANEVTPPVLRTPTKIDYPEGALRDRLEGTVGLELTVDEEGHVSAARLTSPAGHGFDEAALLAVKNWTFEPAKRHGVSVKSSLQLSLPFELPAVVNGAAAPPLMPAHPSPVVTVVTVNASNAASRAPVQQIGSNQTLVIGARPPPPPQAASDSNTGQSELSLRPRYKVENVLEAVPGLFSVQHSGGGKAQQYFLRGFDADHGTDIAFSLDGAPINMVSHGHGQGFSDLHFIIPETIDTLEATKGPYSARVGDFATAGSVNFRMADHVDESLARVEYGSFGRTRLVALESPDLGPDWRMLVAAEVFHDNGPFIHPDEYQRYNGYTKITHALDDKSEMSLLLTAYGGSWNASGVLPARAVCGEGDGTPTPAAYAGSKCLSRWDSLDPSQGGSTQRVQAMVSYRRKFGSGTELEASAYVLRYGFQLFPNDGIAAPFQPDGIQYGSEVEQDDSRLELGTRLQVTNKSKLAGMDIKTAFGISVRNDSIHSELHRDEARQRLDGIDPINIPGPIADSNIDETEIGFYADTDIRPAKWLRMVLGARADRVDATVSNESSTAVDEVSGARGQGQFSPKASVIVSPFRFLDLFANYGRGFHTNDARTNFTGSSVTLISTATGYETGALARPIKGLTVGAVAFLLDLQSELTIDGDDASTAAAGPTRRYGGEFTARYNLSDRIYADAALTISHARYTDQADIQAGQALVALAPVRTFFAGVSARQPIGAFSLYGSLRIKSMSDRPATQDGSLTATGFTLFDADAGVRWKHLEIGVDVLNLANAEWREGQFAVQARLPGDSANPPTGIAFTPGLPRTAIAHATVYW